MGQLKVVGQMKRRLRYLVIVSFLLQVCVADANDRTEPIEINSKLYKSPYYSAGVGFSLRVKPETYIGLRKLLERDIFYVSEKRNEFLTVIWNAKPYIDSKAPNDFRKLNTQVNNMEMTCRIWEHNIEWQKVTYFSKECDLNLGSGKYGDRYGNQYLHFFYYDNDVESKKLAEKVISTARRIQNY